MSTKKKAEKFNQKLIELLSKQVLDPKIVMYVIMSEMVAYSVAQAANASEGLNDLFEIVSIAAGEQGYKLMFTDENTTLH